MKLSRRLLARAILLLVAAVGTASAWAQARVRVEGSETLVRVVAEVGVNVSRDLAWSVLTDYNRWPEFVPDLVVSRVLARQGETLRLEQRGQFPALPNLPLVMILAVEETPPSAIRLQRVAGNVRSLTGEWQLQGKGPVRLIYRANVEPGFPIPPELSLDLFRNEARSRLEAMAQEMVRRAGGKP